MINIKKYINKYKRINSNKELLKNICILVSILLSLFIGISLIEEIFYLSSSNRRNYVILLFSMNPLKPHTSDRPDTNSLIEPFSHWVDFFDQQFQVRQH